MDNWLSALGNDPGPDAHAARLWISHRRQLHAALEAAAESGVAGWLDPPLHFLSELRGLFDIGPRPIGILAGRLLLARLATREASERDLPSSSPGVGRFRAHMLDGLVGELLAEGVSPDELAAALDALPAGPGDDGFARQRNRWVIDSYRAYLDALEKRELIDARATPALVARRIDAGGLRAGLGGARELHVYGPTTLGRRRRLFRALAAQPDVLVSVYLVAEPEPSEWDELASDVQTIESPPSPAPDVHRALDALREAAEVARRVKRLVVEDGCRPSDVAVVARSGREDTHRVHRALAEAGVPTTVRLRTTLAEIPALRALLDLFEAEAAGWDYPSLRTVGTSPYLGTELDVRLLDVLAARRRIAGLDAWRRALAELARVARRRNPGDRMAASAEAAADAVARLATHISGFTGERSETEWIERTRTLTAGDAFGFRRRVCRLAGGRHDVVRLDQRGVRALDALLVEWRTLAEARDPVPAAHWLDRLRRLLEANDLVHSTPLEQGVQVLEAHEAALTPFLHLFVIHANDGEFPRAPRRGGVLSDEERRNLALDGLPLEHRELFLRRERALWRAVAANPATTVSWRSATPSAIPLLPSLMVPAAPASPASDDAVSLAAQRRRDVLRVGRRRRGGDRGELEVVDVSAIGQAIVTAFAEELRSGSLDGVAGVDAVLGLEPGPLLGRDRPVSERAHAWGGRLRDQVVLDALASRFGDDHVWSASRLERYARRPFDFLVSDVLGIERREEAGVETTPLAAGRVTHAVLEALHDRLLATAPESLAAGITHLEAVCDDVFGALEADADAWLGARPVWAVKRRVLRRVLTEFVAWDLEGLVRLGARPIAIEVPFGYGGVEPVRLVGRDATGRPAALLLAGRIDRVDRFRGAPGGLRIVDYKWKHVPSKRGFDDGAVLQPALYMKAWEVLHDEMPREALFLSISRPGRGSRSGLRADRVDEVTSRALSIPERVRAGLFEPAWAASCRPPADSRPGRELLRTDVAIGAGSRFDHPASRRG